MMIATGIAISRHEQLNTDEETETEVVNRERECLVAAVGVIALRGGCHMMPDFGIGKQWFVEAAVAQ